MVKNENMTKVGLSPGIVGIVRLVARHIGNDTAEYARTICLWLFKNGIQYPTRTAIEAGCPPDVVIQAIEENRPIAVVYE